MVFFNLKEIAYLLKDSILFLQNTLHEITVPVAENNNDEKTPQEEEITSPFIRSFLASSKDEVNQNSNSFIKSFLTTVNNK